MASYARQREGRGSDAEMDEEKEEEEEGTITIQEMARRLLSAWTMFELLSSLHRVI